MRKLLILILFIPVSLFGQKKISAMSEITTVDGDAVIPVVQDGTNYKATKDNIQKEVVSNVTVLQSDVTTIENNTSGISGLSFDSDGDTVFLTFAGSTWKLLAVDAENIDVTDPLVSSMEVGTLSEDTVVITFNEAMDQDTMSAESAFEIYEYGEGYMGLGTPIYTDATTIKIPLDSSAESGNIYYLNYIRPSVNALQDLAGNKLISFYNQEIINNIPVSSSIYSHMKFENNDDDEYSNMTFTWTGSEAYKTTDSPPEGTYSTNTAAGGVMTTNQAHDMGTSWTFCGWFNGGNDVDTDARYLLDLDGADIWFDYTDGAMYLEGTIGGQAFQSDLIADLTAEWKWTHMAVTYDGVNGYARTYINGVNVSNDSVVGTGADANGIVRIAWTGSSLRFYGDYDDIQFYKDAVGTDANIAYVYANPGEVFGGRLDPPLPPADIEILWEEDFDDFPTTNYSGATSPAGIPNSYFPLYLTNFESLGSDNANDPDYADNADIVSMSSIDGATNVLKSFYPYGQCCTGATSDLAWANGGTGIDLYAYINADESTSYNEVYLSYNLYIMSGFDNSDGFKQPAMRTGRSDPSFSSITSTRLMIVDWTAVAGDLNLAYYTNAYWTYVSGSWVTTWGATNVRNSAKDYDFAKGEWINITLRCYAGTERGVNGRTEVFINGLYYGVAEASIPLRDTGDPSWLLVNISTFMGGEGTSYTSPKDQHTIVDDFVVWRPSAGSSMIQGGTPSPINRDISGTLEQIMPFPK